MANTTDRQAKQRFVALRVNEVSLVDHPANEREFLVIKRTDAESQKAKSLKKNQETENMSTKTDAEKTAEQEAAKKAEAEKAKTAEAEKTATAEKAKQETEAAAKKAADDVAAAEKAVADATAQLDAVKAKAPPFKKKPGNAAEDAKDGGADDAEEEKKKAAAAEAAKATTKAVTEVPVAKQDPKSMLIQMMCDDMVGRLYKMSSLAGMDVDSLLGAAKSMGASDETIEKMQSVAKSGKKQLSSERMEKFNTSLKGLMDIAKEADPERLLATLKDMMSSLGGGSALEPGHENSPKPPQVTATAADGNGYTATSAVKAVKEAEEKLAKATADLAELKKKVEQLEGATATTKALDGDTTTTQKSKPSMWKGIL